MNGKQAIVFELDSEITGKDSKDEEVTSTNYNFVAYIYRKDREYSVNFNCPARVKAEWQADALQIIESISVK